MTISLILDLVLSAAVLAGMLGLLMSSIASEHRRLTGAEMHTPNRREAYTSHAPLAQPAPVRA
ncbi:MAG: hypothetical protein ACLPV4_12690 [Solirubrobacteraceae bacterium]